MINKIEYPSIKLPSDGWLIVKDQTGTASMMFCGKKSNIIDITFIKNASVFADANTLLLADEYLTPPSNHKQ